ncbi:MAG: hypothetical protein AAF135_15725 [Bacteroidota bacterium]
MYRNPQILIFTLLILAMTLVSCDQGKLDKLQNQNQALLEEQKERDSILNAFVQTFDMVEANMEEIRQRENIILTTDEANMRTDKKTRIISDLDTIDQLLSANNLMVDELNERIAKSEGSFDQYRRSVRRLKAQIKEKDQELKTLRQDLDEVNYEVASVRGKLTDVQLSLATLRAQEEVQTTKLTMQEEVLTAQDELLTEQTESLNTAFVIMGSAKELRDQKVISKEGGFLGIGGKHIIENEIDPALCDSIDITEVTSIAVDTKKAQLVTSHPSDSYTFQETDGKLEKLEITNPDKFWRGSKYLVVVLN